jgi:hypothetical protein
VEADKTCPCERVLSSQSKEGLGEVWR